MLLFLFFSVRLCLSVRVCLSVSLRVLVRAGFVFVCVSPVLSVRLRVCLRPCPCVLVSVCLRMSLVISERFLKCRHPKDGDQ